MNAILNRRLFSALAFDSGSLGVLASIVHQFNATGRYAVSVLQQGERVGSTAFEVDEASTVMQLTIDLSAVHSAVNIAEADCDCRHDSVRMAASTPVVSPKGYVLFHASQGDGYAFLAGLDQPNVLPVFDSTRLGPGDLYALSLIKPDTYVMSNSTGEATGTITVTFQHKGTAAFKAPDTQYIDASSARFAPQHVEVTATQGIVFRVQDAARIVIRAKGEPSARPADTPRGPVRFTVLKPPVRR